MEPPQGTPRKVWVVGRGHRQSGGSREKLRPQGDISGAGFQKVSSGHCAFGVFRAIAVPKAGRGWSATLRQLHVLCHAGHVMARSENGRLGFTPLPGH